MGYKRLPGTCINYCRFDACGCRRFIVMCLARCPNSSPIHHTPHVLRTSVYIFWWRSRRKEGIQLVDLLSWPFRRLCLSVNHFRSLLRCRRSHRL
ncbi:hypothetical protein BRADI_4g37853v3 [Brachypodium distachyon]|uniref:Uncharacterized protein n=1 Tax=Brachypodium distachyon TaxID=15368 RepID=A0A2K2CSY4_BRADI|nr:hypothetical protein BRADI_4g37853v3 [Brachypodium distachyon]